MKCYVLLRILLIDWNGKESLKINKCYCNNYGIDLGIVGVNFFWIIFIKLFNDNVFLGSLVNMEGIKLLGKIRYVVWVVWWGKM